MSENVIIPILTGIFGLISGLSIPFAKWHIEKLRMRRHERVIFIKDLRETIQSHRFQVAKFIDTSLYSRLRPHLPMNLLKQLDNKDGAIYLEIRLGHNSRSGIQNDLLDFVNTLEVKWKLV